MITILMCSAGIGICIIAIVVELIGKPKYYYDPPATFTNYIKKA